MKIVVVSHGPFAEGIVGSVQMLVGAQAGLLAFGLAPEEDRSQLRDKVQKVLESARDEEVLVLSDLFHGTPFNVCVELMEHFSFHHITGINLPLLVAIIMSRNAGMGAGEIRAQILQEAAGTVKDVNLLLTEHEGDEE
jgi:hypothetical protein